MNTQDLIKNPKAVLDALRPTIHTIMGEVAHGSLEREAEILAVMLCLASGTDGAIVGEGGIAKSQMMRSLLGKRQGEGRIDGAHAYMTTLNAGVRPQDLWSRGTGVNKADLGDGHMTVDYVPRLQGRGADPNVRALYFDEYSMAPEGTQESVRSALSDREAYVMGEYLDLKHVWSVWITTNALPKGPLNWRLVCKLEAQEVQQEANQLKMMVASELRKKLARLKERGYGKDAIEEMVLGELSMWEGDQEMGDYITRLFEILNKPTRIGIDEFELLRDLVMRVEVPPTVMREQVAIRAELKARSIHVDGRRFVRTIPMVMAHAAIVRGVLTAGVEDLVVMQHAWADVGEARAFREVVFGHANPIAAEAEKLVDAAIVAAQNAIESGDPRNGRMAINKIKTDILPAFPGLLQKAQEMKLPDTDVKSAQQRVQEQMQKIVTELMGM